MGAAASKKESCIGISASASTPGVTEESSEMEGLAAGALSEVLGADIESAGNQQPFNLYE